MYVLYGLGLKWPLEFSGRFVSYDAILQTPYLQPTLAYALSESLSIGGGLTIAVGSVDLNRREDLARVPLGTIPGLTFSALVETETDFLDTALGTSRTTGIGANLGVAVRLHDRLRIGARYLTPVKLSYTGDVSFTPIAASYSVTKANVLGLPVGTPLDAQVSAIQAAFENQPATTELTMPAQLIVGLSWRARENVTMLADYQWAGWSKFDTVPIDFSEAIPPDEQLVQNYRDTSALRLGVEISATRVLKIRGGYHGNQAAAPDESVTPILPEARRSRFATGLGWQLTPEAQTNDRPSVTLDVGYQFIRAADRRGRIVNPLPGELPNAALNSGMYQSRSNVIGVTVTYRRCNAGKKKAGARWCPGFVCAGSSRDSRTCPRRYSPGSGCRPCAGPRTRRPRSRRGPCSRSIQRTARRRRCPSSGST